MHEARAREPVQDDLQHLAFVQEHEQRRESGRQAAAAWCVMRAKAVCADEAGEPVRYAVHVHVLMSQAEMELWQLLAHGSRLEVV